MMRLKNEKRFFPIFLIAGASAFFLSACAGGSGRTEAAPAVVTGVTVETMRSASVPQMYEAVGTIESKTTSNVGAQVGGTLLQVRVKPGDRVHAGELLAVIDGRGLRAQLNAAEASAQASSEGLVEVEQQIEAAAAQRKFAEATYQRYKALLAKDSVSRQEYDNAETKYKAAAAGESAMKARKAQMEASVRAARAQQTAAETQYDYTKIVSPANGIVTAKLADSGTLVMPGTPLFTIEDPERYRLVASLAAELLPKVRTGEKVQVTKDGTILEGQVAEIVPAADPASRTFVAKVELPAGCACRSGEYATAEFPIGETNGLTVPQSAVVDHGQLVGVFVIDSKGVATYRLVKTGRSMGNQVEILSGLSSGERVATAGLERLRDGVKVEAQ